MGLPLPHLDLRRQAKRQLFIVSAVILAIGLASFLLWRNSQAGADQPFGNLLTTDNLVPTSITAMGACPPTNFSAFKCVGSVEDSEGSLNVNRSLSLADTGPTAVQDIRDQLHQALVEQLQYLEEECVNVSLYNRYSYQQVKALPANTSIPLADGQCTVLSVRPDGTNTEESSVLSLDVKSALKPTTDQLGFHDLKENTTIINQSQTVGYVEGVGHYTISPAQTGNPEKFLTGNRGDAEVTDLQFKAPIIYSLQGTQDLMKNLVQLTEGFGLDYRKSSWSLKLQADLRLEIGAVWDKVADKIQISSLAFCPTVCSMSLDENQHLVGTAKLGNDPEKKFEINNHHAEIYRGTGTADAQSGHIAWGTDLAVLKDDQRSLTYASVPDIAHPEQATYSESHQSHADLLPFQKRNQVTTVVGRELTLHGMTLSSPQPGQKTGQDSYHAVLGLTYTAVNNESPTISQGSATINSSLGNVMATANDEDTATVNSSTMTKYEQGDVLTPFDVKTESNITDDLANQLALNVPGRFDIHTPQDVTQTVYSLPAVHALPKNIILFLSHVQNDPAFSRQGDELLKSVLRFYQSKGTNVQIFDTSSPAKFLAALRKIPDGAWLINSGHGSSSGLLAGANNSTAYKREVTYGTIQRILVNMGIHLSLFAGDSCFSGRANLAKINIGPVGVGFNALNDTSANIGQLIGFGVNTLHSDSSTLADKLLDLPFCPVKL